MSDRAFPAELEATYQEARFGEYRRLSLLAGMVATAAALLLWGRDYAANPGAAMHTFGFRLLVAAALALYLVGLRFGARRRVLLATFCAALVVAELSGPEIWGQLPHPETLGLPGYLYFYLLVPLVLLPFSFTQAAGALVLVAVVPDLQIAFGLAPHLPAVAYNALVWPACAITVLAQHRFDRLFRRVFLSHRALAEEAGLDALTGLANRRRFLERAAIACESARRHGRSLSVLMIDVDHFKSVNDRFGHAAGDDVLRFLAATLDLQLRGADLCGRMGGEEFAVVLPETELAAALTTAERLRRAVEAGSIATDHAREPLRVTLSIGVATMAPSGARSLAALLAEADQALYEAKRSGRNVVHSPSGLHEPEGHPAAR